jgi:hypothetical protein
VVIEFGRCKVGGKIGRIWTFIVVKRLKVRAEALELFFAVLFFNPADAQPASF